MLQGGIYFFQLMDHYVVTTTIIYIALFETIAVCWLYGTDRLSRISQHMTNHYPSLYFRFCWLVAAPLLIMVGPPTNILTESYRHFKLSCRQIQIAVMFYT